MILVCFARSNSIRDALNGLQFTGLDRGIRVLAIIISLHSDNYPIINNKKYWSLSCQAALGKRRDFSVNAWYQAFL